MLILLSVITYLDRVCMNVVSKYVKADLGLNNEEFGYILGAFSLAYALFEIPTGALGDKIGARKVLTRVVVWWSFFTMATGTVTGFISLIFVRFLFGIGEAGAYPNASIVIAHWFPRAELGRAQSAIWAAGRMGGALTPLLMVPLVHLAGWRIAFFILGISGIAWAALWYWWFRNEPREKSNVSQEEVTEIEISRTVSQRVHRLSWTFILKNKNVLALMLMCHFFFYAAYFFTNWSNTYFQEGRGMTEETSKNFISLSYFLGAIGCLSGGFLSDVGVKKWGLKWGRRIVAITGLALSSLLFLCAGLTENKMGAGILLSLCVMTKDLALPVAFAVCVDIGRQSSGVVVGAMNFAGQLGGFFITVLFGFLVHHFHNFNYPLFLISGCLLASAALWLVIDPTKAVHDEPA